MKLQFMYDYKILHLVLRMAIIFSKLSFNLSHICDTIVFGLMLGFISMLSSRLGVKG